MKSAISILTLCFFFGCQTSDEQTTPREVPEYSIEDFLGNVNYRGSSFSPDNGKVLVSSDVSGVYNAYAIPVDGGDPIQLTHSDGDYVFVRGYFPNDERFLYTSDEGGNELNHLYVQDPDVNVTDLTPGEGLKARFYGWSHDDASFLVGTNERDERYFDVYEYDPDDFSRELIFQNDEAYDFADMSPDRQYLALSKTNTYADSDIFLHDRATGETSHVTPHEGDVINNAQSFSPDGTSLLFLTDEGSEYQYLVRHDLLTSERETLVAVDWDVRYGYFSKRGKYLVVGINNDARTELRVFDSSSMTPIELPDVGEVDISSVGFSRDESHMAFYSSSSRMPRDLFVSEVSDRNFTRLTNSLNKNINAEDLVEGKVVRFASYDGLEIPGVLYKPHQASESNKVPALVWVHGGPGGQSRIGYFYLIQHLVNHGYAIYAINNRGSSGYGKTFFHLDDQKHGDADLDDCVESKRMLVETGWVDPERIGIIGGSYGGYMVLAALTFRPDAFNAGVDMFGISNWHRTVTNIPPWWESDREALQKEMGDFDDEEFFRAKSPLFHASNIVRPLMVLQGANDVRVLQAESDEIVEAVRANSVPVEYVLFEDEGHGFAKKENQEEAGRKILAFLDEHLRGPAVSYEDR